MQDGVALAEQHIQSTDGQRLILPYIRQANKAVRPDLELHPVHWPGPLLGSLLHGENALIKATGCVASAAQLLPLFRLRGRLRPCHVCCWRLTG